MRNAYDSDSRCGLACDASACDAKSLAIRVERCEPLRSQTLSSQGKNAPSNPYPHYLVRLAASRFLNAVRGKRVKQMLVQGRAPRPPDEVREPGISSTRDQKTRTVSTCSINPGSLSLIRRSHSTWVKPGRFGSFFVLCFLALGGHCLQMLCLPGFGTHANTQNLPHFRAFPVSIWEHSPPKCLFFKANAKLPNRPGFAFLQGLTA